MSVAAAHREPTMSAKALGLHLKQIVSASREVDFVASTDTVDAYGEIVLQNWQLERFRANPVVLFAHKSGELPIGYCSTVGVENGELTCRIKFCSEAANPKAEQVWQCIQEGSLRAVSVGFMPHTVRMETRDDVDVWVLDDNELLEISVVPIPANPDALMRAKAKAITTPESQKRLSGMSKERFTRLVDSLPSEAQQALIGVWAARGPVSIAAPSALYNPSSAASRETETTMDPKEIEKLQADHRAAVERNASLETQLAASGARVKELEESESSWRTQLKGFQELSSEVSAALDAAGAPTELAQNAPKPGEPAVKHLTTAERITEIAKSRDKALEEILSKEIDALIGVKLAPAQRDDFLAIAKSDRARFDSIVKNLPTMTLTQRQVGADPAPESTLATKSDGSELAAILEAGAEKGAPEADGDLADLL